MTSKIDYSFKIAVLLALAVLLAPSATAGIQGTATEFSVQGSVALQGGSDLLHLQGAGGLSVTGQAEIVAGQIFTTRYYSMEAGNQNQKIVNPLDCDPQESVAATVAQNGAQECNTLETISNRGDSEIHGGNENGQYYVRAFAIEGESMAIAGAAQTLVGAAVDGVAASGGFMPDMPEKWTAPGSQLPSNENPEEKRLPYFSSRFTAGNSMLMDATASGEPITITGDVVLEFWGPDLTASSAGFEDIRLDSGNATEEVVAGVDMIEYTFCRIFIRDADLTFQPQTKALAYVVSTDVTLASDEASIVFTNPSDGLVEIGSLDSAGDLRVAPPFEMGLTSGDDGFTARPVETMAEAPVVAPTMSKAAVEFVLWIAGGAAFVIGVAVMMIRQHRIPSMAQIEAALESGSFIKAARMSKRVIRRDPRQESAQLTRAIAWSRAGRNDRVVKHLQPYLKQHEPSDGTLHYVLGLAYQELGQGDDARKSMSGAVQRTPSLIAEIAAELRPASLTSDTNGYS